MGFRRRFKDHLEDLIENPLKGGKLLSALNNQITLIVGDPLFLTPLLEAGKLEEARQASKVIFSHSLPFDFLFACHDLNLQF